MASNDDCLPGCRYASTCQTVGMNLGYFASFTVFLALNDAGFCNRYLRSHPSPVGVLSLAAYLRAWGWAYLAITLAIAALKAERNFQPRGARRLDSHMRSCSVEEPDSLRAFRVRVGLVLGLKLSWGDSAGRMEGARAFLPGQDCWGSGLWLRRVQQWRWVLDLMAIAAQMWRMLARTRWTAAAAGAA